MEFVLIRAICGKIDLQIIVLFCNFIISKNTSQYSNPFLVKTNSLWKNLPLLPIISFQASN